MNIEKCLKAYSDIFYHEMYGINHHINSKRLLEQQSIDFLNSYGMSDSEYRNTCFPIMERIFKFNPREIFDLRRESVSNLFCGSFNFFAYHSSPLFWKRTYEMIQNICKECKDCYIYIIEAECCEEDTDIAFKIKIPACFSWEKISCGGYITDVLFNMFQKNYFVFGDSGKWGRWCDYDNDIIDYEIFGFKLLNKSISDYKDFYSISYDEFREYNYIPNNLKVGFWNNIKKKQNDKIIYFYYKEDKKAQYQLKSIIDIFATLPLRKSAPLPANEIGVTYYIEYDKTNEVTTRYIILGPNNDVVEIAPNRFSLGWLIDEGVTLTTYTETHLIHYIDKEFFEDLWIKASNVI